jgi:hypothetical protein
MKKLVVFLALVVHAQVVTSGFTKTVTTSGTAVTLTASRTLVRWATVQALNGNTGAICIGGSDVTCASNRGVRLSAGQSLAMMPIGEAKDVNRYNLATIYIDASVSGEGVQVTYVQ